MKTIIFSTLLIIMILPATFAQGEYSGAKLSQAPESELNYLLGKARTVKTIGVVFTSVGTVTTVVSLGIMMGYGYLYGLIPLMAGLAIDVIGIPIAVAGSRRMSKVNYYKNASVLTRPVKLEPCIITYGPEKRTCSGIKFAISF